MILSCKLKPNYLKIYDKTKPAPIATQKKKQ